jgi:hypothetical protein
MRKILLPLVLLAAPLFGQHFCYTTEMQNQWFAAHPELKAAFESQLHEAEQTDKILFQTNYQSPFGKSATAANYTIPVVFHILHAGGSENISDAQVIDAVNILTRDFNADNADTSDVVAAFKNKIGNPKVAFKLATIDPQGQCTNGIVRHYDLNTDWTSDMSHYIYTWPRHKYLNIYVVKTIESGAAGYTYLPGTGIGTMADAIVILSNYVGSIGSGNQGTSRALTHEVGHWLNLPHVWGYNNQPGQACGDDGVSDTPVTKGYTSCSINNTKICNPSVIENIQNYMDYAYCQRMFTIGQSSRMVNALNSSVAGRNNLSTAANLAATGVNQAPVCGPIAQLLPFTTLTVCVGQNLTIKSFTHNGTPTSYQWSANNGATITDPSAADGQVLLKAPGDVTVTCVVSNSGGSYTSNIVVTGIGGAAEVTGGYVESFESFGLPLGWSATPASVTWELSYDASSHGVGSMLVAGDKMPTAAVRILESPSYDFKNNPGAKYTFKYAYRKAKTTTTDVFKVQATRNCGGTWVDIYVPGATQMALGSGETGTATFVPTSSEWKFYDKLTEHPGFLPFLNSDNVRFRFYFKVGQGGPVNANRFYLDEINFTAPVGVNEVNRQIGLSVFPNPSTGAFTIGMNLHDAAHVSYSLRTITGSEVLSSPVLSLPAGEQQLLVDASGLAAGIYLLHIEKDGLKACTKLVVE